VITAAICKARLVLLFNMDMRRITLPGYYISVLTLNYVFAAVVAGANLYWPAGH